MVCQSEGTILKSLVCLLIFVFLSSTYASKDTEKHLKSIEGDIKKSRQRILVGEKQKREILFKVFHLNKKIKQMSEEKSKLTRRLQGLTVGSKRVGKEVSQLGNQVQELKKELNHGMRILYKMRGQGQLRALFSSASPQELERNIHFLTIVSKRNYQKMKKYQKKLSELSKKKTELRSKVRQLLVVKNKMQSSEKKLHKEQKKKSRFISQIEKEREWYINRIKEIRKKSKNLNISENSILGRSLFFEEKGRLEWPVQARVVRGFGFFELDKYGSQLNHKGLLFAKSDEEIKSVGDGIVSFAGSLSGYEKVVVLDHGDNYYTVYGHLTEVFVGENEKVSRQQALGSVSFADKKGLYFEIRHYSNPEDPLKWLKVHEIKVSSNGRLTRGRHQ